MSERGIEIQAELLERLPEGLRDFSFKVILGEAVQTLANFADCAHAIGDVCGELHHFGHLVIQIEDRVVGSGNPHFTSGFA